MNQGGDKRDKADDSLNASDDGTSDKENLPSQGGFTIVRSTDVKARDRLELEVDFERFKQFGIYQQRPRTKRGIGASTISWIYKHGIEAEELQPNGTFDDKYWICALCYQADVLQRPLNCRATNSAQNHLRNTHFLTSEGPITDEPVPGALPLTHWFARESSGRPLAGERFKEKLVNCVTKCNLSFHQAADEHFRDLLLHSGPLVANLLPAANTVRAWIISTFKERRMDVKASLASARSRINLSFDGWSAPNGYHLLGVVGHWIDKDWRLQRALLSLTRLYGAAGEEDIEPALSAVITFYDLGNKLGAFQMDNATNNDTALRALAERWPINVQEQRLRCFGHIVNLVVKALLFGEGLSKFQKDIASANDDEQYKLWRKQGAIGKLHNIVVYITRSHKRAQAFSAVQLEAADDINYFALKLKKDLGVRWNSVYTMIERALKLQGAIDLYCAKWKKEPDSKYDLTADFLDEIDWEELRDFRDLLKPFYIVTKRVEGHPTNGAYGAIWEVLPAFNYLFNKVQKAAKDVIANTKLYSEHYESCLNCGFEKLKEYYTLTDNSRLYRAAVALHPGKRFHWFELTWIKEQDGERDIANAKEAVKSLWQQFVEELPTPAVPPAPLIRAQQTDNDVDSDDEDYLAAFSSFTNDPTSEADRRQRMEAEFDTFINSSIAIDRECTDKPLQWWIDIGEPLYPTLASLAYSLFSIPGMSAECERAFSHAKKLVTEERFRLKEDIIEADQCVKSWLYNGLVDGSAAWRPLKELGLRQGDGAEAPIEL